VGVLASNSLFPRMTADIKQLTDPARDENKGLTADRVRASMGSALTQSYIENHSDLLAAAILCDTLGAIPGIDEDGIVKLFENTCGSVDVSGLCGET
jgi:pimeloyl-ACP methyl ester carboxylesterase